jgi:thioredoxin-like negative regulator of GroEL
MKRLLSLADFYKNLPEIEVRMPDKELLSIMRKLKNIKNTKARNKVMSFINLFDDSDEFANCKVN